MLTVGGAGTASSPTTYAYTDSSGNSGTKVTVNYTNYTVASNFGLSGTSEYKSAAAVPLVSSIVLPDGSQYSFTYEATPSVPSTGACTPWTGTTCVTARLASVTLPTGGMITYAYSGGNNGILADGSVATLTRGTPDGTWIYAQTKGTGAASTTTITAPILPYDSGVANQTTIQFQGIYETQRVIYQGSTAGTALSTINTCYNASTSPCTATSVALPISQRTVIASVPGPGSLQSQHTDKFDSFGNITESDDYDFSSGTAPLLRQTLTTYATPGGYLHAFPQTVTVKDGSGSIQSRTDTSYDQYSSFTGGNCITGAPNHNDAAYGCSFIGRANPTAITTYTNPSVPSGAITKNFTYDSLGNLRTAQLNCCQLKTFNYSVTNDYAYPDSVVSGISSPTLTTNYTYDLNMGLTLTTTDPNNIATTLTYDNLGRTLTAKTGSNPTTNYTYNDSGTWYVKVCSPVQGTNTMCQKSILDSQGRIITNQILDSSGTLYSATDSAYDSYGRLYRTSNPYTTSASYWTQTNLDALGRVLKTTLPDGSLSTATYSDNSVTLTDPVLKQRKKVSDGLGRLTTVFEPDPSSGNTLTLQTSYSYNAFNQLLSVTEGSQSRSYSYDAIGRITGSTTPEAGTVCYGTLSGSSCQMNGYDNWNNLLYQTDARGVQKNFIYDSLNRLVGVSYTNVPGSVGAMPNVCATSGSTNNANVCVNYGTTAASYNNGRIASMTDPSGSESYTYDQFGNITQLSKNVGGTAYITNYAYNLANEITQITYPSSRVVQQSFDAIGRLCAVGASGSTCSTGTTYASGFNYNPAFQITGFSYGNGVTAAFGISPDRLQLASLAYTKSSSALFSLNYSYGTAGNNNGQIAVITDNMDNGRTATYSYDALYRLTNASTAGSTNYPAWGLGMSYDRYGNRQSQSISSGCVSPMTCPTNSVTVSAGTNRFGSPYMYDANGNMTNDGLNTITFDGENHAVASSGTLGSGTYTFDGNGLRVKKLSGSTTTVYVFSNSKVIAEYVNGAAPSSPTREYLYYGSTLIAKIEASATKYYHQDHLSNRVVTDSSGIKVAEIGHFPFGESWYNSTNDKLVFTSYERDAESGNDHAMARIYVSRLGRFASPDPFHGRIGNPQSLNRYSYALNDPIRLKDPTGLYCIYYKDNGEDIESMDQDSSAEECSRTGGQWVPDNSDDLNNKPADITVVVTADPGPEVDTQSVALPGTLTPSMVSNEGLQFIAGCEGFRSVPYNDSNGHCTVGYGHLLHRGACTADERQNGRVNRLTAIVMFSQDLQTAEAAVNANVTVPLTQEQYDALVDFTYNLGPERLQNSTLLRELNAGNYDQVAPQMEQWRRGGPGIPARRANEGRLFNGDGYADACYIVE